MKLVGCKKRKYRKKKQTKTSKTRSCFSNKYDTLRLYLMMLFSIFKFVLSRFFYGISNNLIKTLVFLQDLFLLFFSTFFSFFSVLINFISSEINNNINL